MVTTISLSDVGTPGARRKGKVRRQLNRMKLSTAFGLLVVIFGLPVVGQMEGTYSVELLRLMPFLACAHALLGMAWRTVRLNKKSYALEDVLTRVIETLWVWTLVRMIWTWIFMASTGIRVF